MAIFYLAISLYLLGIVIYAFVIRPYAELLPIERIQRGYLLWNENWDINHRARGYYHVLGLYRYWWQALQFKYLIKSTNRKTRDLQQLDPHRFYEARKSGHLF